jgi:hypothetical protein
MWIGDLKRSEIFNASFVDGITLSGLWGGARRPGAPTRMFKSSPVEELEVVPATKFDLNESDEPAYAWLDIQTPSLQPAAAAAYRKVGIPVFPGLIEFAVWQLVKLLYSDVARSAGLHVQTSERIEPGDVRVVLTDKDKRVLQVLSPAEVQRTVEQVRCHVEQVRRHEGSFHWVTEHQQAETVEHSY